MQKIFNNRFTIAALSLWVLIIVSCSNEDVDITNLDETIFVRHKNADMPAYIHGNASEKVFLIILHGGPGGNGLQYRANTIRTEIERNNAVVYFDQRGSGNAQGNYSKDGASIDIMAEDVLALAKVIKAKYGDDSRLFLMGHSWGGALGPATLLKDQQDFLGWIDVDGAHNPKGLYDEYQITLKETADAQIALGNSVDYWQDILDLVEGVGNNYSLPDFAQLNGASHNSEAILAEDGVINQEIADLGGDARADNEITFIWNSNGIRDIIVSQQGLWEKVSFTDRLHEITIPSLVLWGKYDLVVPTAFAQESFDNLGATDKEIFIFERSAHSPMFAEPDLFANKVIEFINRHK